MNTIQDVGSFCDLTAHEKKTIYSAEIDRIESYIYKSEWYLAKPKNIRKFIKAYKPWLLYETKDNTPVRIYGYAEDNFKSVHFMIATMEDDEQNTICFGKLNQQSINRIRPVSWQNMNGVFIDNLKKAIPYGGDVLFLKPEMFLYVGGL